MEFLKNLCAFRLRIAHSSCIALLDWACGGEAQWVAEKHLLHRLSASGEPPAPASLFLVPSEHSGLSQLPLHQLETDFIRINSKRVNF